MGKGKLIAEIKNKRNFNPIEIPFIFLSLKVPLSKTAFAQNNRENFHDKVMYYPRTPELYAIAIAFVFLIRICIATNAPMPQTKEPSNNHIKTVVPFS